MPPDNSAADMPAEPISRGRRVLFAGVVVLLPLVALALAEGIASLMIAAAQVGSQNSSEGRSHTRYDSLLGWSSIKGLSDPSYYGPNKGLHIDSLGFREPSDVGPVAPGKRRVVCLGDSFTFAHGVADGDAWCARLAQAAGMQSVNMGQVGFGIDQDLLWYRRDGQRFAPDLLILAFVKADFNRTRSRIFGGVPKPWLEARGDSIVTHGVPVMRLGPVRRFTQALRPRLASLALWRLAVALKREPVASAEPDLPDNATWTLSRHIIGDLAALQRRQGRYFVAVLIPAEADYLGTAAKQWSGLLQSAADSGGFRFVDLVQDLKKLPPDSVPPMYIHAPGPHRPEGHLTTLGNAWVAQRLAARFGSR